jgi:hypothetical protein
MYTYVRNSVVNMKDGEKVVSQAILGERLILDGEYAISPDGYRGLIDPKGLVCRSKAYAPSQRVTSLMAHIYSSPDIENGPLQTLSFGTPLEVAPLNERWSEVTLPDDSTAFIQNGDISPPHLIAKADIPLFAKRFLGLPYTWGGRSSFGFDCSGFVQMLYKEMGILLPRDSKDQFLACTPKNKMEVCDLIFWGKSEDEIRHVGLYLGNKEFIHATAREHKPWLRISHLDDKEWSGMPENYYPFRAAAFSK